MFKFFIFLLLSLNLFSQGKEISIRNAVEFFEEHEIYESFNIRTANQLQQPGEIVTTINHRSRPISGYTARIAKGDEYLCRITLFEGYEYVIIAAGDNNVVDIDLFIYDEEGNTVAIDRSINSKAYATLNAQLASIPDINNDRAIVYSDISVRPLKTQRYWVKVKLRDSLASTNDVGFIIGNRKIQ